MGSILDARLYIASHQSYRTQEDRYGCKRPRISRSNLKQERRNHTGREESCNEARTDTDEGHPDFFADYH
jgi:hypothetical protein